MPYRRRRFEGQNLPTRCRPSGDRERRDENADWIELRCIPTGQAAERRCCPTEVSMVGGCDVHSSPPPTCGTPGLQPREVSVEELRARLCVGIEQLDGAALRCRAAGGELPSAPAFQAEVPNTHQLSRRADRTPDCSERTKSGEQASNLAERGEAEEVVGKLFTSFVLDVGPRLAVCRRR